MTYSVNLHPLEAAANLPHLSDRLVEFAENCVYKKPVDFTTVVGVIKRCRAEEVASWTELQKARGFYAALMLKTFGYRFLPSMMKALGSKPTRQEALEWWNKATIINQQRS